MSVDYRLAPVHPSPVAVKDGVEAVLYLSEHAEIPIRIALIMFTQTFGGGLFLAFAQPTFSPGLIDGLGRFALSVDAQTVIAAGAMGV